MALVVSEGLEAQVRLPDYHGVDLEIDLKVAPGEIVALLGPNGAGKTTTLAVIAGLVPNGGGLVALGGRVLDHPGTQTWVPPEARGMGMVFQDGLLFPHMSVIDNVAFGPRSRGLPSAEARRLAGRWLEEMGVSHLAERRPPGLSGGERQRVALARALAVDPATLLLDEPFSSLDVSARAGLRAAVARLLAEFHGPCLLVTHDPVDAFLLADRVYVIESGRVSQQGDPDSIRLGPRSRFAADLAGVNLLHGTATRGAVQVGGHRLVVVGEGLEGPVLVTIRPNSVAVHPTPPQGSPRNTWATRIEALEVLGDRARLRVAEPMSITAEVSRAAFDELGLTVGKEVWLAVKATEIGVEPEHREEAPHRRT